MNIVSQHIYVITSLKLHKTSFKSFFQLCEKEKKQNIRIQVTACSNKTLQTATPS